MLNPYIDFVNEMPKNQKVIPYWYVSNKMSKGLAPRASL